MINVVIREMAKSDVQSMAKLSHEVGFASWSEADYLVKLNSDDSLSFVAEVSQNTKQIIVAFLLMRLIKPEAEIINIAVKNDYRRQGIGEKLLNISLSIMFTKGYSNFLLEVRETNLPAIALYKKKGFLTIGKRKDYYSNPKEDALVMMLHC